MKLVKQIISVQTFTQLKYFYIHLLLTPHHPADTNTNMSVFLCENVNLNTIVEKINKKWQRLWLQPVLSPSIHIITELKPGQDPHLENNSKPCSRRWHDATRCQLVFLPEDSNSGTLSAEASCQLQQEAAGVQQAQGARTQRVLKWDGWPLTFLQFQSNLDYLVVFRTPDVARQITTDYWLCFQFEVLF